jgi:hypothetical protein
VMAWLILPILVDLLLLPAVEMSFLARDGAALVDFFAQKGGKTQIE